MGADVIRCSKCQRAYTSLNDFEHLRSVGLALKGLCRCGAWVSVGALWRKQPEAQNKRLQAPVSADVLDFAEPGKQISPEALRASQRDDFEIQGI